MRHTNAVVCVTGLCSKIDVLELVVILTNAGISTKISCHILLIKSNTYMVNSTITCLHHIKQLSFELKFATPTFM